MSRTRSRRRRWPWLVVAALVLLAVPAAVLGIPILTHQNQGLSHQDAASEAWPHEASATGDDGRTRTLVVAADPESAQSGELDTSALVPGQHLVVTGSGYDGSRGIYVAICVIPPDSATKPGPCVGGVPDQEQQAVAAGTVQYAPSNWINDDWAWKLFGARSYDDLAKGTFTAYIEVGEPKGSGFDCSVDKCGLFTRNDHTALTDRVQDLYLPIAYG